MPEEMAVMQSQLKKYSNKSSTSPLCSLLLLIKHCGSVNDSICNTKLPFLIRHQHCGFQLNEVQGWTLALAHSPRRVSKVSGECKSQITRPFGECDFSSPRNWLNCKINDVFYTLFCREISKHKLTIVHICMAKFYTPNCPKNGRWSATLGFAK